MMIGKWSEFSSVIVSHVVCVCSVSCIVDMSGDVFCWFLLFGIRVGVFVLSIIWFEFCNMFVIVSPRWSLYGENHVCEWAFMSPVMIVFVLLMRCWSPVLIMLSSFW